MCFEHVSVQIRFPQCCCIQIDCCCRADDFSGVGRDDFGCEGDIGVFRRDGSQNDRVHSGDLTPFELYVKFLIEYFGPAIDYDPNSERDLPKGVKSLSYQGDAVNDGWLKLQKHGGFFLADVVDYYKSGGFAARNGAARSDYKEFPFRVLMVFKTAERRNNTAERLLQSNLPVFKQACLSTLEEVTRDPFDAIWIRP